MKMFELVRNRLKFGTKFRSFSGSISPVDRLLRVKPSLNEEREKLRQLEYDEASGKLDGKYDPNEFDMFEEDESDDPDPRLRLGKQLLRLGKVNYRYSEKLPEWLIDRQKNITSYRTQPQIRRCLNDWMLHPNRELQEQYRFKESLTWRKKLNNKSNNLKLDKINAYGTEDTIAYSYYFLPARFNITKRVFNELKTILPNFVPSRIIDFGCGPATAGAAAAEVWNKNQNVITKYCGVDISQSMLDAASIVMSNKGDKNDTKDSNIRLNGISSIFWNNSGDVVRRAKERGDRFDLAVASYTLTELVSDPARCAAVQMLYELLDVNGCLVIIDTGNPIGSHTVRAARKFLLDHINGNNYIDRGKRPKVAGNKSDNSNDTSDDNVIMEPLHMLLPQPNGYENATLKVYTVAPCTHDKECPLGKGIWCSFSQKVYSSMIRKDNEEKFSYVIIRKVADTNNKDTTDLWLHGVDNLPLPPNSTVTKYPTPINILQQFMDNKNDSSKLVEKLVDEIDWDEYSPPLIRNEWSRVLRSPMKHKGHVTVDICTPLGTVDKATASKSLIGHIPSLYTAIRKVTWGGLFPIYNNSSISKSLPLGGLVKGGIVSSFSKEYDNNTKSAVQLKVLTDGVRPGGVITKAALSEAVRLVKRKGILDEIAEKKTITVNPMVQNNDNNDNKTAGRSRSNSYLEKHRLRRERMKNNINPDENET